MPSIFSRIISGEIPCYKVGETEDCIAFLDISPLTKGHTLVVPKVEIDHLFQLENSDYGKLMLFAKQVGRAIEVVVPCKRIGVTVIGLEVPHAHVHLIPINAMSDMNFANPRVQIASEELTDLASKISRELLLQSSKRKS
jgi:histidine triad (HIT) family protein